MTTGSSVETLARPSRSSGNGDLSWIVKLLSPCGIISSVAAANDWPSTSRAAQRFNEAMQSTARTGSPS
jgi:hypothetical protein